MPSATSLAPPSTGILCGTASAPHIARSVRPAVTVTGAKNFKTLANPSAASTRSVSYNVHGSDPSKTGGRNRALAAFQNPHWTNTPSHHCRHRSSVRRSIPSCSRIASTRAGFNPCIIADTSTTTNPA